VSIPATAGVLCFTTKSLARYARPVTCAQCIGGRRDFGFAADHSAPVPLLSNPLLERRLRRHAASRLFRHIIAGAVLQMSRNVERPDQPRGLHLRIRRRNGRRNLGALRARSSPGTRAQAQSRILPFSCPPVPLDRSWPYSAALSQPERLRDMGFATRDDCGAISVLL
jgi:hypothetical protein